MNDTAKVNGTASAFFIANNNPVCCWRNMEDVTTGSGATPYDVVWNGGGVRPDGICVDPGRVPL